MVDHAYFHGMDDAANGTSPTASAWALYDELIAGIPEDAQVVDYARGLNWSFLQAECGSGVSYTLSEGAKATDAGDLRGRPLKEAAALAKSWDFKEATIGVAALNAWYGQPKSLEAMDAIFEEPCAERDCDVRDECKHAGKHGAACPTSADAFEFYKPEIEAFPNRAEASHCARVAVVGHFPHVEDIAEYADLTVLERRCRNDVDVPDPACEYVLPGCDYAFLTGVTLINKTMPRLLQLSANARTVVVGPSAVASPVLFDYGVDTIAGRCVVDPEGARFAVTTGQPFGASLRSFIVNRL